MSVINNSDSVLIGPPAEVFYGLETEYTARPVSLPVVAEAFCIAPIAQLDRATAF